MYKEIEGEDHCKVLAVYIGESEMATDSNDVSYVLTLEDSIAELKKFDDELLFPYLKSLILKLEMTVQPSGLTQ